MQRGSGDICRDPREAIACAMSVLEKRGCQEEGRRARTKVRKGAGQDEQGALCSWRQGNGGRWMGQVKLWCQNFGRG